MKYLVVSFILFFCTLQTFGQQEYFAYLQTEDNQPFYIRINNNVYSATSSGYLILSKLPDSTASVTIGFPKNVFPEQRFNIPTGHKDAGYVLKNFGDRGWGLFNLQTQAVIMNSNPPQEKKSPEITGIKKNDAFSLLLANAVNDTAVLYAVVKPPKPVPAPVVAVVEEKKIDTTAVAKQEIPKKDSNTLVKNIAEKKDSSLSVKNNTQAPKDSLPAGGGHQAVKELAVLEKNKKPVLDTVSNQKNTHAPAVNKPVEKTAVTKNNTAANGKYASNQKKDTIIITSNDPAAKKASVAKNNDISRWNPFAKEPRDRKDTIIFMNGKKSETGKPVAKNTAAPKENKLPVNPKKDSLQLVKNDAVKKQPEEKPVIAASNPVPVLIPNAVVKNDTAAALAKNDPPKPVAEKTDSIASNAIKRQRPLVNKAAELLTDTSYVAVFVDESTDNFDTIRISIPFNEIAAFAKQDKPLVKETKLPDSIAAGKIAKDSPAVAVTDNVPATATKKDTNTAGNKDAKDTTRIAVPKEVVTAAAKTDTGAGNQHAKDSNAAIVAKQTATPVKKDSTAVSKPAVDSPVATAPVIKKDTSSMPPADSGKPAKTPAAPLFLNSDCKEVALDADIDKLRVRMLLVASDDDRIALAKKLYRLKCFSVKQVKALSELFKTDEGKYKWFDAIYPYVSDSGNFSSLGELIKNDYYINRFKAMLRN